MKKNNPKVTQNEYQKKWDFHFQQLKDVNLI